MNHRVNPNIAGKYEPAPKKYGRESNEVTEEPESPSVDDEKKKYVQQVVGSFQYYARAFDTTIQHTLNAIAEEQSKPTARTLERVNSFWVTWQHILTQ